MLDFLKNLSKQAIVVAVLMVILFFANPAIGSAFFVGVVVGLVAGNLYAPVERWIEDRIADFRRR